MVFVKILLNSFHKILFSSHSVTVLHILDDKPHAFICLSGFL